MAVNANESVEWLGEERKCAWDYFQLHSSQRIASFNFYITLATASVAAIGTISSKAQICAVRERRAHPSIFFWRNHFSYTDCFNLVFFTFGLLGLLGTIVAIIRSF